MHTLHLPKIGLPKVGEFFEVLVLYVVAPIVVILSIIAMVLWAIGALGLAV